MSIHIVCVTSGGGLPVFTRKKGNIESLSFPIIGSLNGVHMFGKPQNISLLSASTEDFIIAWREFEDSLVLIGIASGCTIDVLDKLLESIFCAIILIVGIAEIKSQRNIERMKRELKICYPLIDRLMHSLDCGLPNNKNNSDLVGLVDCILCPENHLIQILLESYSECIDSLFSCVIIHGKIATATDSWWSLHAEEINLLLILATTESSSTSKDIPVFLPYKSPSIAFRFVSCTLIPDVQICSLCGPTPNLEEIEHAATQCFKSSTETLHAALQCFPRNFPIVYQLDPGILGILLINTTFGKYMMSKNPQHNATKKIAISSHRMDILRSFYYHSVRRFLSYTNVEKTTEDLSKKFEKKLGSKVQLADFSVGKETYWCSEYHKCHAMIANDNILCVLYNSSISTYAMALYSQRTLKMLLSDKQVCW